MAKHQTGRGYFLVLLLAGILIFQQSPAGTAYAEDEEQSCNKSEWNECVSCMHSRRIEGTKCAPDDRVVNSSTIIYNQYDPACSNWCQSEEEKQQAANPLTYTSWCDEYGGPDQETQTCDCSSGFIDNIIVCKEGGRWYPAYATSQRCNPHPDSCQKGVDGFYWSDNYDKLGNSNSSTGNNPQPGVSTATIGGRVTDSKGAGVDKVKVWISDEGGTVSYAGGPYISVTTGPDGRFNGQARVGSRGYWVRIPLGNPSLGADNNTNDAIFTAASHSWEGQRFDTTDHGCWNSCNFTVEQITTSPEDIDNNRCIGVPDFNIWLTAFKTRTILPAADVNKDNKVDLLDYNLWFKAFTGGKNRCSR